MGGGEAARGAPTGDGWTRGAHQGVELGEWVTWNIHPQGRLTGCGHRKLSGTMGPGRHHDVCVAGALAGVFEELRGVVCLGGRVQQQEIDLVASVLEYTQEVAGAQLGKARVPDGGRGEGTPSDEEDTRHEARLSCTQRGGSVRDGVGRRLVKAVVRSVWQLEWAARAKLSGAQRWRLTGSCNGCGACCESPTIAVGRLLWWMPTPRALFLAWQHHVNGFVLTGRLREARAFVFRCTHFDPATRTCDSYASRPFMCRHYPRILLEQAWPTLFSDCSYEVVDAQGAGLAGAIDTIAAETLTEAQAHALKRALRLPDETPE